MTQAVIYARVSTEEQAEEGVSLDAQVAECLEFCDRAGWSVVGIFRDEGVSGARRDRKGLRQALEQVPTGGALVVYRLDRLSRDVEHLFSLVRELSAREVVVRSPRDHLDISSASGRAAVGHKAVSSQELRELIGENVAAALRERARRGRTQGRAPFGYRRRQDRFDVDPPGAQIVRLMFGWAEEGLGLRAIATRLRETGLGRPSDGLTHWHPATVWGILTNPAYRGNVVRRHGRRRRAGGRDYWQLLPQDKWEVYPSDHEAIIGEDQWQRVQAILRGRRAGARSRRREYLLSGILRCARCGGPMSGCYQGREGQYWWYYRCSTWATNRACRGSYVNAQKAEDALLSVLRGRPQGGLRVNLSHDSDPRLAFRAQVEDVKGRRRALLEALETRQVPPSLVGERLRLLEAREADLKAALAKPRERPRIPRKFRDLAAMLRAPEIPLALRRDALARAVKSIVLHGRELEVELRTVSP